MPQTEILVYCKADGRSPMLEWLGVLERREPKAYAKCVERIGRLASFGNELRRPLADSLRDGIYELRADHGNVNYRILYFFRGRNVAVLSHGTPKEGVVPPGEIDKAIARRVEIERDPDTHITTFE